MRAVVQRVDRASVTVNNKELGNIGTGLLIYLGVQDGDTEEDVNYLAPKIAGLRVFSDDNGAMNLSVIDIKGAALVISQFTLLGDVRRGRRPSFATAMAPKQASSIYQWFIAKLAAEGVPCERGQFGAQMQIRSTNNGPVTILLDSKKLF